MYIADALSNKKGWGFRSAASYTKSRKRSNTQHISSTHQKAATLGK